MLRRLIICILLGILGALAGFAEGREVVVLVIQDGISLDELFSVKDPAFQHLLARGALGVMNTRTADALTPGSAAVTIGAGARGCGELQNAWGQSFDLAAWGFNSRESVWGASALQRFVQATGITAPDTAILQTEIKALQQVNAAVPGHIRPGQLGELLQHAGVTMAVYGNADQGAVPVRHAVAIAMNAQGWVPTGDVGRRTTLTDVSRPFGMRTDYAYLMRRVLALKFPRACMVVDTGDGSRLEAASPLLSTAQIDRLRSKTVTESWQFLTRLDNALAQRTDRYLLLLTVLTPNGASTDQGDLLTPIFILGSEVRPGVITSSSTKRAGIVMNLDIAPTILRFFGLTSPANMPGGLITVGPHRITPAALRAANQEMVAIHQSRSPVLKGFILVLASSVLLYVLLSLALCYSVKGSTSRVTFAVLRPVFLAVLLTPLVLLIAPSLGIYRPLGSAIVLVLATLLPAIALSRWVRDVRWVFAGIGMLTALVLCGDLLLGAPLLKSSLLSYSPIIGIRFYGLGNEYSGVLIGALLLGIGAWLDLRTPTPRWLLVVLCAIFVAVFLLIGSPRYGSDFGGMFAAIAGFSLMLGKLRPGRPLLHTMLLASLAGVALVALVLALNMRESLPQQTHIGHAFVAAQHKGPGVLWEIAVRKWAMNWRLVQSSWWAFALASMSVGALALAYRPINALHRTLSTHPALNASFLGILVAMSVALLTNDSGVVMAATGLLYLVFPLMMLIEGARKNLSVDQADHASTTHAQE
ncbi:MAG: hypothetical protein ACYC7E_16460 [Armatimonadota bacterium]